MCKLASTGSATARTTCISSSRWVPDLFQFILRSKVRYSERRLLFSSVNLRSSTGVSIRIIRLSEQPFRLLRPEITLRRRLGPTTDFDKAAQERCRLGQADPTDGRAALDWK